MRLVSFDEAKTHARLPESVLGEPAKMESGDAEKALAAARYKVDVSYKTPRYNHNAIELHAATLFWNAGRRAFHS